MLGSLQVRVPNDSACFVNILVAFKGYSAYKYAAYFSLNKPANYKAQNDAPVRY